ncbi:MAG: hypothetical protein ACKVX7_19525 [Planctomycetota bacterium]
MKKSFLAGLSAWLRAWRSRRRLERATRAVLSSAFADPALLKGTSLRPDHRPRVEAIEPEVESNGELRAIRFAIARHPRPFSFSRQFHEVVEWYRYDLTARTIVRAGSVNLTKLRGRETDGAI